MRLPTPLFATEFAYISVIFAMAYIGSAFTAGHFWKERNAAQPKVTKNSSLIHPALHSASLRSGFPPEIANNQDQEPDQNQDRQPRRFSR
jgi:hypothetical protein